MSDTVLIPCNEVINDLADLENRAAFAARNATNINDYGPYAELRDGIRKAIASLDEIAALPAEVRERMEGRDA